MGPFSKLIHSKYPFSFTISDLNLIIIDNSNNINNDIIQGVSNLGLSKADLIMHPARFMVLQSLAGQQLTTQEISDVILPHTWQPFYKVSQTIWIPLKGWICWLIA